MNLTKSQSALVDEGVACSKIKKNAETRLEEIKVLLEKLEKGTYTTTKGGVLIIGERDNFEVDPETLLSHLKKEKKSPLFHSCISVIKKSCDAVLGSGVFDTLKKFKNSSKSYSFK